MKMLLVLFDKQGQILLCRNPSGYSVPTNGAEVDEGFGFGSPQEEKQVVLGKLRSACISALYLLLYGLLCRCI